MKNKIAPLSLSGAPEDRERRSDVTLVELPERPGLLLVAQALGLDAVGVHITHQRLGVELDLGDVYELYLKLAEFVAKYEPELTEMQS
ncbi:hypothetical protein [Actinomadura atramentaria]|uniref:hypothetical protein n=1 Tax=Actinomadura atramentaria TaxID=1990 RepID=UPI0012FA61AA|nr:hypothetical protein [Actinomadura atramentaria]